MHLDIKPENFLVDLTGPKPVVKLTDFDLAQTELVALAILATAPTDEILFKNISFTHAAR